MAVLDSSNNRGISKGGIPPLLKKFGSVTTNTYIYFLKRGRLINSNHTNSQQHNKTIKLEN